VETIEEEEDSEEDDEPIEYVKQTTRSGRRAKKTLEQSDSKDFTFSAFKYAFKWTPAEEKFHSEMRDMGELNLLSLNMSSVEAAHGEVDMSMIGAIRTNFNKTQDLHVMNYKEAMEDPRVEDVKEGIKTEHAIDEIETLPGGERVVDTMSAIKTKPTGESNRIHGICALQC